jgi:hypothetical protein
VGKRAPAEKTVPAQHRLPGSLGKASGDNSGNVPRWARPTATTALTSAMKEDHRALACTCNRRFFELPSLSLGDAEIDLCHQSGALKRKPECASAPPGRACHGLVHHRPRSRQAKGDPAVTDGQLERAAVVESSDEDALRVSCQNLQLRVDAKR